MQEGALPLFCVIMAGEPTINDLLSDCPGLRQKIEIGAQLTPMTREDAPRYLSHRLEVAGGSDIFEADAVERLYEWSGGIARLMNIAADLAMLAAYGEEKKTVNVAAVDSGLEEIETRFGAPETSSDSRR